LGLIIGALETTPEPAPEPRAQLGVSTLPVRRCYDRIPPLAAGRRSSRRIVNHRCVFSLHDELSSHARGRGGAPGKRDRVRGPRTWCQEPSAGMRSQVAVLRWGRSSGASFHDLPSPSSSRGTARYCLCGLPDNHSLCDSIRWPYRRCERQARRIQTTSASPPVGSDRGPCPGEPRANRCLPKHSPTPEASDRSWVAESAESSKLRSVHGNLTSVPESLAIAPFPIAGRSLLSPRPVRHPGCRP